MTFPFGNGNNSGSWGWGYRCNGCGQWVPQGTFHSCYRPSAPYTPPPSYPPITIQPGVSEERVKELIREALDEFRKDEVKRKQRGGA